VAEQTKKSEEAIEAALAAEREASASLLEAERAKFSEQLAEALAAEAEKGGVALEEYAIAQREQTNEMLTESRQMWTDTLESNRAAMASALEAQEGKFVEIADSARRRTQASLEAEVERSNAARKSALDVMGTSSHLHVELAGRLCLSVPVCICLSLSLDLIIMLHLSAGSGTDVALCIVSRCVPIDRTRAVGYNPGLV